MNGLDFDAHTHFCLQGEACNLNAAEVSQWDDLRKRKRQLGEAVHLYLGVHPWYANQWNDGVRESLVSFLIHRDCEGIGEIGLDFAKVPRSAQRQGILVFPSREQQLSCFREQLELARRYQVPVSLHLRGCMPEFQRMTETLCWDYEPGLVHGWGEDEKWGYWLLEHGWKLSFRNPGKFYQKVVKEYGNVQILRETDRELLA